MSASHSIFQKLWIDVCAWRQNTVQVRDFLVRLSALCLGFSILFSGRLWFQTDRVIVPAPIWPAMSALPENINAVLYGAALLICGILLVAPRYCRLGIFLPAIFTYWILQDQLRWQPFVYMYVFSLFALAFTDRKADESGFDPIRVMIAGVYFWAGAYKINTYFMASIFPWFVEPIFPDKQLAMIIGIFVPFEEAFIGLALLIPRLRIPALLMATVMLVVVLASLGPFGHNWGHIVWPWNVYLYLITFILFFWEKRDFLEKRALRSKISAVSAALFVFLPALGGLGYWGMHPSFMLYSGMPPMAVVKLYPRENLGFLPADLSSHIDKKFEIDLTMLTIKEFHVASTPGWVSDDSLHQQGKGLCSHLKYPDKSYLIIMGLEHPWSTTVTQKKYPLCNEKQG